MSDSIFPPRKKREPLVLQLTAMIDVFSMIVIFLIFGTVFGAADIVIPDGLQIPKSLSREGIDSAPRLLLHDGQVSLSLSEEKFPLRLFQAEDSRKQLQDKFKPLLQEYQSRRKGNSGTLTNPVNLIADRNAHYRDIYDVISFFRELGFDSVYFVATGETKK